MERLTDACWRNFDPWECCGQDYFCKRGCHDEGGCTNGCIVPKLYCRLAAYEDFVERWRLKSIEDASRIFRRINALGGTDLMGQYRDLGPINHLRSLVQAEKDGRLVVLPPNDPMTLEELREMDGEPVWVEIPTNMVSEWCIAKFDPLMNRVRLWCSGGGWFDGRNVGKSLFVYRRKPEEV